MKQSRLHLPEAYDTSDIVIIGGGIAGLYAALHLAPHKVTVITTASLGNGTSSSWAQGGIAAALSNGDSAKQHKQDTLKAGGQLCQADTVDMITRSAGAEIECLERLGIKFDRAPDGQRLLSHEAAHSKRRVLRIGGDQTGFALMKGLIQAVKTQGHVHIIDRTEVLNIGRDAEGRASSVIFERDGRLISWGARAVILATGGIGGLFAVTTNPDEVSGRGLALALKAGAQVGDIEFVQFHPTALAVGQTPAPLLTEALRGEGAMLIDGAGAPIMPASEPLGDLAPRDVVAAAVDEALRQKRGAFLDCRAISNDKFAHHFPQVLSACKNIGIDPRTTCLPIAPAAHYHMGGIVTNLEGETTAEGLYAIGECAATGAHGANRLASNSLLESLVFAKRAAHHIHGRQFTPSAAPTETCHTSEPTQLSDKADTDCVKTMRQLMSSCLGVIRNRLDLIKAEHAFTNHMDTTNSLKCFDQAMICRLIATAALKRDESRGAHRRSDAPQAKPEWQNHLVWQLDDKGRDFVSHQSEKLTPAFA